MIGRAAGHTAAAEGLVYTARTAPRSFMVIMGLVVFRHVEVIPELTVFRQPQNGLWTLVFSSLALHFSATNLNKELIQSLAACRSTCGRCG